MLLYDGVFSQDSEVAIDGWSTRATDRVVDDVAFNGYIPPSPLAVPDFNPMLHAPDGGEYSGPVLDDVGDYPVVTTTDYGQRPGDIRLPSWNSGLIYRAPTVYRESSRQDVAYEDFPPTPATARPAPGAIGAESRVEPVKLIPTRNFLETRAIEPTLAGPPIPIGAKPLGNSTVAAALVVAAVIGAVFFSRG